jgi:hypothetical protein
MNNEQVTAQPWDSTQHPYNPDRFDVSRGDCFNTEARPAFVGERTLTIEDRLTDYLRVQALINETRSALD